MNPIVHIVCHTDERAKTMPDVIKAWLDNYEGIRVVVSNCSPTNITQIVDWVSWVPDRETLSRLQCCSFYPDPGNRIRHAVALAYPGSPVIQADDDVMPLPGFTEELLKWHKQYPDDFVGVIGRTFKGPEYYGNTTFYAGKKIKEPVRTGFIGVVYVTGRDLLPFDCSHIENPYNDLCWQMEFYPSIPKWVVPVTKFANLKSAKNGLFHDPEARVKRSEFYKKYYLKNYKPRGMEY